MFVDVFVGVAVGVFVGVEVGVDVGVGVGVHGIAVKSSVVSSTSVELTLEGLNVYPERDGVRLYEVVSKILEIVYVPSDAVVGLPSTPPFIRTPVSGDELTVTVPDKE